MGRVLAEAAQAAVKAKGSHFQAVFRRKGALLDITDSVMQDLPNQAAQPMGHRPNRSVILQARHRAQSLARAYASLVRRPSSK